MSLAAAAIYVVLAPFLAPVTSVIVEHLGNLPVPLLLTIFGLAVMPFVCFGARGRLAGLLGWAHFWSYPPIGASVVLAVLLLMLFAIGLPELAVFGEFSRPRSTVSTFAWRLDFEQLTVLIPLASYVLCGILWPLFRFIGRSSNLTSDDTVDNKAGAKGNQTILNNPELLRLWLEDDRPVERHTHALFGHNDVARRIANRLMSVSNGNCPTMALVGDYGAGKTTIRRLVERRLAKNKRVRVVPLSLWAFDSAEGAAAGIIRALIQELSRQVNVLGIRGLSEEYVSAMAGAAGRWGGVLRLASLRRNPEEIIARISTVAQCIGLSLVLWIEDLERFTGLDVISEDTGHATAREAERLGPIRALLYHLDNCPFISVVVADASLRSRFDLSKIARFVERTPSLNTQPVWELIERFRKQCQQASDLIDPANPKTREKMRPDLSILELSGPAFRRDPDKPSFHEAFSLLLRTPRSLKGALRTAQTVWDELAGEIDLDDVIVMSVIRASDPTVFAFIEQHIDFFRRGFDNRWSKESTKEEHPKFVEFMELLKQRGNIEVQNGILALLSSVFPIFEDSPKYDDATYHVEKPQNLRRDDYWLRFLTVPDIPISKRDQPALRSIELWKGEQENDLIERLLDSDRSGQIVRFVGRFQPEELIRLMRDVVAEICGGEDIERVDVHLADPITSIWRMMHSRQPDEAKLSQATCKLICDVMTRDLSIVHDLCYQIGGPGGRSVSPLLSDRFRDAVRDQFEKEITEQFSKTEPEKLVQALGDADPYLLFQLCWRNGGEGFALDKLPFANWNNFANVLLSAAEKLPEKTVRQIIPFITHAAHRKKTQTTETGTPKRVSWYDIKQIASEAERLFHVDRLIPILHSGFDTREFEDDMKELLSTVQKALPRKSASTCE